ncbi:MAG: response regulator [Chloroflexi bacterium]|nr:response regulator [Chloroflexota bacterium]
MTTWMVIDDEPGIYEMVLAMYETWGFEGLAFVSGEDAMGWIENVDEGRFQGDLPQFALLDIRLPGQIDGVMIGARLRQSPYLRDIGIVLMTAFRLDQKQEKAALKQSGADLLLYKPLSLTEQRPQFEKLARRR